MLIAIDIGNTNIVVGGFEGSTLKFEFRMKSDSKQTVDEYYVLFSNLLAGSAGKALKITGCIVSSVVPPLTPTLVSLMRDRYGIEPLIVGPGIKTGVLIKLADPNSVGADRVVNAVAAKTLFGAPALVIDFGTATSFDYIGNDGNYEGGIIVPGALVSLESLVQNTAKLPRIEFAWPKSVIGKSTVGAMQSGIVLGYLCLIDGLVDKIVEEVGHLDHIVATGGLGRIYSDHSAKIRSYDPHLTLKGMEMIARLNS